MRVYFLYCTCQMETLYFFSVFTHRYGLPICAWEENACAYAFVTCAVRAREASRSFAPPRNTGFSYWAVSVISRLELRRYHAKSADCYIVLLQAKPSVTTLATVNGTPDTDQVSRGGCEGSSTCVPAHQVCLLCARVGLNVASGKARGQRSVSHKA